MIEPFGQRMATRRTTLGWTQQELAERVTVSRVAISHFEAGLQVPSERTIALLAGVFGCEPHELVAGTSYPRAKADRLPLIVARYTAVEHELALLDRDLFWLDRYASLHEKRSTLHAWCDRLARLHEQTDDRRARHTIDAARHRVLALLHEN